MFSRPALVRQSTTYTILPLRYVLDPRSAFYPGLETHRVGHQAGLCIRRVQLQGFPPTVSATLSHGIFRHAESETTAPMPAFANEYGLLQVFR